MGGVLAEVRAGGIRAIPADKNFLPKEDRFIRVENKIVDGNMLLIIQNTKVKEKNEELLTTKEDKYTHGRGITSVKKIVEKYNGDISFIDRGEGFEVIAKIYDVESKE